MKNSAHGFTLVEMLLVIGILVSMAAFSAQRYLNDYQLEKAQTYATDMMTIANAAVSHSYDNDYKWSDESNAGDPCSGLVENLGGSGYYDEQAINIESYAESEYTTSCDISTPTAPVLKITKDFGDVELAKIIEGMLPAASVTGSEVTMYVLKPRGGGGSEVGVIEADDAIGSKTGIVVDMPECGSELKFFAQPSEICSPDEFGVESYRVRVSDTATQWGRYLEVKSTRFLADYINVSSCGSGDIKFTYAITCG
ncbi:hypothetical protein A9Q99_13830 [Gammaproteobacteria bacterium 45_16_T64]|nr:hypothetical protein A9Q99_13830 [Gammaproteobacteria bacterium 45_16_T64]